MRILNVVAVVAILMVAADVAPVYSYLSDSAVITDNLFEAADSFPGMPHFHEALSTLETPLVNGLVYYAAAEVGRTGYVFGGETSIGDSDRIYRFDPGNESLTQLDVTLPSGRRMLDAAYDGSYVYLFGGMSGNKVLSEVLRFHPGTETITSLGDILPYTARGLAAEVAADDIYVLGGFDGAAARDEIHRFDPSGPAFVDTGARMPIAMQSIEAVSDGDSIHVMGGRTATGTGYQDAVFRFTPDASPAVVSSDGLSIAREWVAVVWDGSNAWALGGLRTGGRSSVIDIHDPVGGATVEACLSLGVARSGAEALVLDGVAYIIGGQNDAVHYQTMVRFVPEVACPASAAAPVAATLPDAARGVAAATDGRAAYLFGGWTGTMRLDTVHRFDPGTQTFATRANLPEPSANMAVAQHLHDVYLFGGTRDTGLSGHVVHYDLATDTMTDLGNLIGVGAWGIAATYHNGSYYLAGGNTDGSILADILRFDPETATVTDTGHDLPAGRYLANAWANDTHVFFFGGRNDAVSFEEVLRYDPDTGIIDALTDLAAPVVGAGFVADGQSQWFFGSEDDQKRDRIVTYATTTEATRVYCDTIPEPLSQTAATLVDGTAWLFGGHLTGNAVTDAIVSFRPHDTCADAPREWRGATLPQPSAGMAAARAQPGVTYLVGGPEGAADGDRIRRYTEDADVLETVAATLPEALSGPAAVFDGTRHLYVLGGRDAGGTVRDTIHRYDTFTGALTTLTPLPAAVEHAVAAMHDGAVYLLGGIDGSGAPTDAVVRYDPTTDTATTEGWTLPHPLGRSAAGMTENGLFLFGGQTDTADRSRHVVAVDLNAGSSLVADMRLPIAVRDAQAGADVSSVWVAGGNASGGHRHEIYRYDSDAGILHRACTSLPVGLADAAAAFAHTREALYLFGGDNGVALEDGVLRIEGRPSCHHDAVESMDPLTISGLTHVPAVWTGRYVYAFGGRSGGAIDSIHRYDPFLDETVTIAANLPVAAFAASAVWTGGVAYIFGGDTGFARLNTILRFDPATETITTLASVLPSGRSHTAAIWDGTHAYVFGGRDGGPVLHDVLRFDPAAGSVTNVATLTGTQGRWDTGAAYDGRYAYLLGGRGTSIGNTDRVWRFDPTTLGFAEMPGTLSAQRGAASAVFDRSGTIYVFGGHDGAFYDQIEAFDVESRLVTTLAVTLDPGRSDMGAAWIGNAAILIGGNSAAGALDALVRFDPDPDPAPPGAEWVHDPGPGVTEGPTNSAGHYYGAAVTHGNLVYQFGGFGATGSETRWFTLDPLTGVITDKPTLPFSAGYVAAAVVDDSIYVTSGTANVFYRLDLDTETWTQLATFPAGNQNTGALEHHDGALYAFGGCGGCFVGDVGRYDIATDTWSTIGTIGVGGTMMTSVTNGTHFFITGGNPGPNGLVAVFDPVTETSVTHSATAPESPRRGQAAFLDGAVYVFGGPCCAPDYIQKWDPVTKQWTLLTESLFQGAIGPSVAQGGGTAYVLGGWDGSVVSERVTYFQPGGG